MSDMQNRIVQPPYGGYKPYIAYSPQPPKPKMAGDKRDVWLAAALAVLALLTANLTVFGGFQIGFPIAYVALILCGGIYRGRLGGRVTGYSLFCTVAAIAGAGVFVWHNDGFIKFLCFVGVQLLTAMALVDSTGLWRRCKGGISGLLDVLGMLFVRPLTYLGTAIPAIFRVKEGEVIKRRQCGGVFLGLLCALPALLVVIPLLVSADAAFEGLLQHTLLDNLGELISSLLLGTGVFCLLYSRWFSLRYSMKSDKALATSTFKGIEPLAVNSFLAAIVGVYGLYLVSQLAYFFSAFSGILPDDYTAAEYARRGFFEMCALCAVNLGLVAGSLALVRKQEGRAPLSTRLLQLFILLFSLGLVAVALSKMALYIDSFGMTRLRVLTSVFMLMLAVILVFVAIRLFAVTFPYMQAAVVAIAILGLVTAYVDVDTTVARYNVTAYQQGQLETVDVDMLGNLSDGAVPYLIELLDDGDETVAKCAANELALKLEDVGEVEYDYFTPDEDTDWREYNIDKSNARQLLIDNADKILDLKTRYY